MGPSLPSSLLRGIGVEAPFKHSSRNSRSLQPSRKDLRKAARSAAKGPRRGPPGPPARSTPALPAKRDQHKLGDDVRKPTPPPTKAPPKSILKRKREPEPEPEPDSETASGVSEDGVDSEEDEEDATGSGPVVSKAVRQKLAEDDSEIADLERKLGLKRRKQLPQSFKEDGLGDLLGEIDGLFDDEEAHERKKRKTEADEWLAEKRRKAAASSVVDGLQQEGESDDDSEDMGGLDLGDDDDDDNDAGGDDDDLDSSDGEAPSDLDELEDESLDDEHFDEDDDLDVEDDEFEGFDSESDEDGSPPKQSKQQKQKRENPYVAPTSGAVTAKYVPPSQRGHTGSDQESTLRIRRQTQGLINRLTEANMISILGDIEKLYREHPRQHVTSIISDLLLVQICNPSSLPDTLLILTAGFATAVYRVIGMDFGAHLVQVTTERFKELYERAVVRSREQPEVSKEASNLVTFLSELYNFQLIGSTLLFDYIRLFLEELSELNAELLLRVIRMCGTSLRQDDPMALKDIVALIRPAMERTGEQNISVRTKFMIETINDLKNNKMKAGVNSSAVVTEHTVRMRKLLGSMNSRKLKSTEPLRIGLRDIEESDKRGKWWLVGSSWAGATKADSAKPNKATEEADEGDAESDNESSFGDGFGQVGAVDVSVLAREQMMNTDVRRSIFVAIMSATDCDDAQHRVLKIRLNKDRQREIPNVLLRCAGSEQQYNPYYALVARRLCSDRKVRWAFQDALWKLFRRLGESLFGEAADDDDGGDGDEDEATELRRIVNVAKMYGSLVAEGVLGLQILKCLNLVYLRPKTRALVEVLLITAMLEAEAKAKTTASNGGGPDEGIQKMFRVAADGPDLARGLKYFLKKVLRKSDLAGSKANTHIVRQSCRVAEQILENAILQAQEDG